MVFSEWNNSSPGIPFLFIQESLLAVQPAKTVFKPIKIFPIISMN